MRLTFLLALASLGIALACKAPTDSQLKDPPAPSSPVTSCQDCNLNCAAEASRNNVAAQITCVRNVVDAAGPGWLRAGVAAADIIVAYNELTSMSLNLNDTDAGPATESAPSSTDRKGGAGADDAGTGATSSDTGGAGATGDAAGASATTGGAGATTGGAGATTGNATGDGATPSPGPSGGAIALTAWSLVNNIATAGPTLRPRWLQVCVGRATQMSSDAQALVSLANAVREAFGEGTQLSATTFSNVTQAMASGVTAPLRLSQAIATCAPGLDRQVIQNMNAVVARFANNISELNAVLGSLTTLATCGIGIGRGLYFLGGNLRCAANDIESLRASVEALERQRQSILPAGGANQPCVAAGTCDITAQTTYPVDGGGSNPSSCNGESPDCATWGMKVYGEHFRRQYAGIFDQDRLRVCAEACIPASPRRRELCAAAHTTVFTAATRSGGCGGNFCIKEQCETAMNQCISYCCSGSTACANEVRSYGRRQGWLR